MSETKSETPAAKEGAVGAEGAKAKAGPPIVLIAVVLVAVIAGAALGAFLIAPPMIQSKQKAELATRIAEAEAGPDAKKKKKDKGKGKKKDDGHGGGHGGDASKSPIYRVDNVIVNPAGSHGQRFLMCSVAVQLDDEALVEVLRARDVEVRDLVISTLESNTLAQLTQPGARDTLRIRLTHVLQPLLDHEGEGAHMRVFLPQFVIQ